jgi:type IV pilus assembly protein PilA
MKKRQGFTLVELLAVIVILAIILVIAIPNVIKVIDKAKLDTYKRNEDMLVSATQKYMAANGISLNVGETTTINYSQLQTDKLLDKIIDQTSKGECSNSKIYVTKTSSGYTYKPGLVCDNYISLDTFNLVLNSNFVNGLVGWSANSSTNTINNNILINTSNGTSSSPYFKQTTGTIPNMIIGRKYFVKVETRATNSNCNVLRFRIFNVDVADTAQVPPTINKWYNLSGIVTATAVAPIAIYITHVYFDSATANGNSIEVKEVIALDLNEMGLESKSASEIDTLINKSR